MYSVNDELRMLKKGLTELKLVASDHVLGKFEVYLDVLYSHKDRLHLISHKDYTRISIKHFLPSLLAWQYLGHESNVCDIGSGAGFPSIPLKILLPNIQLTLVESVRKRADFLKHLISELKLNSIEVVNDRAENITNRRFDVLLIRAAGKIREMAHVTFQLLRSNGNAIFYKSASVTKEVQEAKKMLPKYGLALSTQELLTPVVHEPITLVFLRK